MRAVGVALCFALSAWAASAQPVTFFSFEEEDIAQKFSNSKDVTVERTAEHATDGRYSLKVTFPPYNPKGGWWPRAAMKLSPPLNWSGYRRAEVDVHNPQTQPAEIGVIIAGWRSYFPIGPGETKPLSIPLKGAREVESINFIMRLHVKRPGSPTVFYLDNLRLHPKTLEDGEGMEVILGPPAIGGKLLASVPAQRLSVEVRLDLPPDQIKGLQVRARLADVEEAAHFETDQAILHLPAPSADETLTVELLDRDGKAMCSKQQTIRRLPRAPDEVGFDERGRCMINGKPFFPIGIYNAHFDDFGLLKDMGFNSVGPYFEATGEYAAEAKRLGLRILSSVKGKSDELPATISAMKDCGVLLGYYLFDEPAPGEIPREKLTARCQLAASADPYHPITGCNNNYFSDYAGVSDVMMVDSYPIPASLQRLIDRMIPAASAMRGRGPVWLIPQCFGHEAYCKGPQPNKGGRPPTYDELRSMCWLGVALGAQGIVFYSHAVQDNRTRFSWPITWQGLEATVKELSALHDVLLAQPLKVSAKPEGIFAAGRDLGDGAFIAVVNSGDSEETATLADLQVKQIWELGADRQLPVQDGRFTDALPPRTTRLYCSRALDLKIPGVAATRARLAALQAERDRQYSLDAALHERGAELEASWGLPKNARGYAWRRMIDGYRGTSWRVGSPGYFLAREGTRWPPEKTQRGDRWVEVKLPESKPIERIVVVSANTRFELLAGIGGKLTPLQAKSTQSRDYHQTEIADIAESALAPPQKVERLRLTFTRDALPDKPELIFEIEAYEAAQE